jgi:CheY-like chemotaxis protein
MVVDVFMPGLNGFELIARIKADHRLRDLPILLTTGQILNADQLHTLKGFGVALLQKPWRNAELINRLEHLASGTPRTETGEGATT